MEKVFINGENLSLKAAEKVIFSTARAFIEPGAIQKIKASFEYVKKIVSQERIVYGINTGFGNLSGIKISKDGIEELQKNLILSHSAGVGDNLSLSASRAVILVRANSLAKGYSGVRLELINSLLDLLNKGVYPVIPSQGSVGSSGDLAPLAHLSLVLIGQGSVFYKGKKEYTNDSILKKLGIKKIKLLAKEGLALINGTCVMTGIGLLNLLKILNLIKCADIIGAMSLEALQGTASHFDPLIHKVRNYPGSVRTARNMRRLLKKSQIISSHKNCQCVQDPYCLRCIPQVHGAVKDSSDIFSKVILREINSATDNPLIFPYERKILSGGNFHGAPVALALDCMAVALSYLGTISERRTDRLLNSKEKGLPPFLTQFGGLHSGLMISQYTAASLASENKVLAHPSSVDTIPTSGGFEDHVSMGTWASRKLDLITGNIMKVLAIELVCAACGLDYRKARMPGAGVNSAYSITRDVISPLKKDRNVSIDINRAVELIESGKLVKEVEKDIGALDC